MANPGGCTSISEHVIDGAMWFHGSSESSEIAESAESAGIFAISGKSLWALRRILELFLTISPSRIRQGYSK